MTPRARFADVVRGDPVDLGLACLLVAAEADPDTDVDAGLAALDALAARVARHVGSPEDVDAAAAALAAGLGDEAGFRRTDAAYRGIDGSLLPVVLRRRTGLPILLSVVWLEVARRLGVPAHGVGLPGHFVVAVGRPGGAVRLVDPSAGGRLLAVPEAAALASAASGTRVGTDDVLALTHVPGDGVDLLTRVLANIRATGPAPGRPGADLEGLRRRLWATELTLLLPRHPLALRREQGLLLARVGRHLEAASVLRGYADAVEGVDPTAAEAARAEARTASALLN